MTKDAANSTYVSSSKGPSASSVPSARGAMSSCSSSNVSMQSQSSDSMAAYRLERYLQTERLDGDYIVGQRASARRTGLYAKLDNI